ncbi:MAG: uroporphyrinogen decarboxylase [Thermodesulfobacteria bacterium]|nr:uroporphyrinogen decarboxylase [Thermodesulfobacteriota bacterium]
MRDIFLRACRGERTAPVPVWFMRQAGRYLPEYQEIRGKADFLTMCKTPELAAQVTLQPVDLLGVDAAILFSDILIPLEAMGAGLSFVEGKGPVLDPPVRSDEDFKRLHPIEPEKDVPFVLETIKILRRQLADRVPLIGFAGAPFTMATYLVEGGTTKSFVNIKKMLFSNPALFRKVMDLITDVTISYLSAQIDAGAQAIQLFDTWAGVLTRHDFRDAALIYARRIFNALRPKGVPMIYFVYDGGHLLDLTALSGADVIGLDWRTDVETALKSLGPDTVVQGNLDPCLLFLSEDRLRERISEIILQGLQAKAHIFNLGHGVLPEIPPEKVKLAIDIIHELSA